MMTIMMMMIMTWERDKPPPPRAYAAMSDLEDESMLDVSFDDAAAAADDGVDSASLSVEDAAGDSDGADDDDGAAPNADEIIECCVCRTDETEEENPCV